MKAASRALAAMLRCRSGRLFSQPVARASGGKLIGSAWIEELENGRAVMHAARMTALNSRG